MKNKNSWELKKGESIYTKSELKQKIKEIGTKTFKCICGKRHLTKNVGQKH
ncbi:MAG: hypothetical protein IIC67_06905 [Thaumarchaeota archaeon]|nr:hypothetical protein [Nitrososphaerota archaeon]